MHESWDWVGNGRHITGRWLPVNRNSPLHCIMYVVQLVTRARDIHVRVSPAVYYALYRLHVGGKGLIYALVCVECCGGCFMHSSGN